MHIACVELSNGVLLPAVGLGSFKIETNETNDAIHSAIDCGYRAIDGALIYGNEKEIGMALKSYVKKNVESSSEGSSTTATNDVNLDGFKDDMWRLVDDKAWRDNLKHPHSLRVTNDKRDGEAIFVTSKVWMDRMDENGVTGSVEEHLQNMDRLVVDLMLLHWPGGHSHMNEKYKATMRDKQHNQAQRFESWRALERLHHEGKIRAIGVSNFLSVHLQPLIEDIKKRQEEGDSMATLPMVNQLEMSPFLMVDEETLKICRENHIRMISYSTLGSRHAAKSFVLGHLTVVKVAERYQVEPSTLILRWALQHNFMVIPKSSNPINIKKNKEKLFGFTIKTEDMELLNQLNKENKRTCPDPNEIA